MVVALASLRRARAGKSQAKTRRIGAGARFLGAIEALEDIGQVLAGDTRPRIADDEAHLVADTRQAHDHVTALRRVLNGIAKKILKR